MRTARRLAALLLLAILAAAAEPRWHGCAAADGSLLLRPADAPAELELAPVRYDARWQRLAGCRRDGVAGTTVLGWDDGVLARVEAAAAPGGCTYRWTWEGAPAEGQAVAELIVPAELLPGLDLRLDGAPMAVPATASAAVLASATAAQVVLAWPDGRALRLESDRPLPVQVVDFRRWGPRLLVRLGRAGSASLRCTAAPGLDLAVMDGPERAAGPGWIALDDQPDTAPGSAFDARCWLPAAGPAVPGRRERLWGANLVKEAVLPGDDAAAAELAGILVRQGYNAVRLHQHERPLAGSWDGSAVRPDPVRLGRWDALVAALGAAGLRLTTDASCNLQVPERALWDDGGDQPATLAQVLAVNDRAFALWRTWAHALFGHVNPRTGTSLARDPALVLLALTNEANPVQFLGMWSDRVRRDWEGAWRSWRAARGLPPSDLPRAAGDDAEGRLLHSFLYQANAELIRRQQAVLRDELGCTAPTTALNGWCEPPLAQQGARDLLEVVDEHFYLDHPRFPAGGWTLPFAHHGRSALTDLGAEMRWAAFSRIHGRPFTVTEFNAAYPNPYRAGDALALVALAGIQGWDAVWRFAWSHGSPRLSTSGAWSFDLASDPLARTVERFAAIAFRRGDIAPAPGAVAIGTPAAWCLDGADRPARALAPAWAHLAWRCRVGTRTGSGAVPAGLAVADGDGWRELGVGAYAPGAEAAVLAALGLAADAPGEARCPTGEVAIDAVGRLQVATSRLAVAVGRGGDTVTAGPLAVRLGAIPATVAALSLDGRPLEDSGHLLVALLTQVVNSGATSLRPGWRLVSGHGTLPHLLRRGHASTRLRRAAGAPALAAWALDDRGLRCARAAAAPEGTAIALELDNGALPAGCLVWELTEDRPRR